MGMSLSDLQFLHRLNGWVQIGAIVLGLLAVLLQASKFYLDRRINGITRTAEWRAQATIEALQAEVGSQAARIEKQEVEKGALESRIVELVNKVEFESSEIFRTPSGYSVMLRLRSTRSEPLGRMTFEVQVPGDSEAKITDFWPTKNGSPFVFQDNSLRISPDGKSAQLRYELWGNVPTLQVNVSAATNLKIKGNHEFSLSTVTIDPKREYPHYSGQRNVAQGSIRF